MLCYYSINKVMCQQVIFSCDVLIACLVPLFGHADTHIKDPYRVCMIASDNSLYHIPLTPLLTHWSQHSLVQSH